MSERVAGAVDERGHVVARKRALSRQQATSLTWEAEVLAAARHPGVVELLAAEGDDAGVAELTTAYTGIHSLATSPPLPVTHVAAVCASLASTLADLHGLGVVHGRVEPTHVLLGPGGRPILCGFSGATLTGRPAPPTSEVPGEFVDPWVEPVSGVEPASDVYGLGAILSFLLRGGGRRSPHAGRRRVSALAASMRDATRRRALAAIADRATRPETGLRPTARELAAAIHDAVPAGRLTAVIPTSRHDEPAPTTTETNAPQDNQRAAGPPARRDCADRRSRGPSGPVGEGDQARETRVLRSAAKPPTGSNGDLSAHAVSTRRRPWGVVAAGACGIALLGFAWVRTREPVTALRSEPLDQPESGENPRPPDATDTAESAPPPVGPQPVVVGDNVVALGSDRYEIGVPGDQVVLGDWDCDGVTTPGLFRPTTGEAFVFNSWAVAGDDLTVRAAAQVPDAVGVLSDDRDGDGCHALVVERANGERVEVTE
ncbi:MAG: hypothetical protein ACRD29_22330 [Acidimicrobiales bacterium]